MEITFTGLNNKLQAPYLLFIGGALVEYEELISMTNTSNQVPTGLDAPLQITFGAGVAGGPSDPIEVKTDGSVIFHTGGSYRINFLVQYGRSGGAGVSHLFLRQMINGVQVGTSAHIRLDDSDVILSDSFEIISVFPAGVTLTTELLRDSAGNNSGELVAATPTPAGWNIASSVSLEIGRFNIPA
jgi:hypothetical protein